MRLFAEIQKTEARDDGSLIVSGLASSEAIDADGEIVEAAAMRAAIPEYMRWGNIREMHQAIAAGKALAVEVGDDGKTNVTAHVVDKSSVEKIKAGVLKGFSIAANKVKRAKDNAKKIISLVLTEISLVDRPSNPDCVFDVGKAAKPVKYDEGDLSAEDLHEGAAAHKDFREGKNPPQMVADEDKWEKAKAAALETYKISDSAFWPATVHIYKKMGGKIKGKEEKLMLALETKVIAKAMGLNEMATDAEISEALLKRLATPPASFVPPPVTPPAQDPDTLAMLTNLAKGLASLEAKYTGAERAIEKVEKRKLMEQAATEGKIVPFTDEEIYGTDTKPGIGLDLLRGCISKLAKTVNLAGRIIKPLETGERETLTKGSKERAVALLNKHFATARGEN